MFSTSQQFSQTAKAMIEAQLGAFTRLAQTAFDAGVCAADLNVDTIKTALAAQTVASNQLFSAKDPVGFLGLALSQSQQSFARAMAYSRQAASLASGTQANFSQAAQLELAESKRKVGDLMEAARKAPAGAIPA